MRQITPIVLGLVCIFYSIGLMGCSESEEPIVEEVVDKQLREELVTGNRGFGFELLHELFREGNEANIFMSPLSISIALAMAYNGAAGETQRAMAETLDLTGVPLEEANAVYAHLLENLTTSDPDVELNVANSIWAREGREFYPDFIQRVSEAYQAEVDTLDFVGNPQASLDTINGWVDTNTKGRIPVILDHIDPNTAMLLLNAIYFKGAWQGKFNPARTQNKPFYLLDGSEKLVPMMNRAVYPVVRGSGFSGTRLPYGQGRISMYIFVPHDRSGIHDLLEIMTASLFESYVEELIEQDKSAGSTMSPLGMELWLPRFKFEYEIELEDALTAMGMGAAFDPGADFSKMGPPPLWMDQVRHKSFVEVNEEGTEAAAVTVITMLDSADWEPTVFMVDRPFFFAIRDDDTGAILFMGVVIEPMQ